MRKTTWAWVSPLALLAALALAGCGGGGGGGGGSSNNGGGGGTPNPFTLTATPGHGFDALSWSLPGAPAGTTYTIQRATSSGGSYVSLPTQAGGTVFTTAGTTYADPTYANANSNGTVNVSDPNVGTQYFYKVASSTGATTDPTSATPQGPPLLDGFVPPTLTGSSPATAVAPYSLSDSNTNFIYTVSQATGTAKVTMKIVVDYNASPSDLQKITVNVTGGTMNSDGSFTGDQVIPFSALNVNGGVTINASNPREIDVDTSLAGIVLPSAPGFSLVLVNAYVATAHGGSSFEPVGIVGQVLGTGQDNPNIHYSVPGEPYSSKFTLDLKNRVSGT